MDSMAEALAYCRLIYDDEGRPRDWVFAAVNEAFGELFGRHDVVGKGAEEIWPGFHATVPAVLETCSRVVASGKPERMATSLPGLERWLDIRVSSPRPDYFLLVFEDITERKRLEETLFLTQLTVERAPELIHWVTPEGRVAYANRAASELLGYTREEIESMRVWDFDPALTPELFRERWEAAARQGGAYQHETTLRSKGGGERRVEISRILVEVEGRSLGVNFARDVTERRAAEEALLRTQFSLDHVTDYPIWVGSDGRILEVSESTCTRLGYSRQELLSMTICDIDPRVSAEAWARHWNETEELGPSIRESLHRKKSGETFPVEVATNRVSFGGQEYDCGFCRDISERKRLEESLFLTQLSVDEAPDMIFWIDADGRLVYANRSMSELLGYSQEELRDLHIWDLNRQDTPEIFAERRDRTRATGHFTNEDTWVGKDDREHRVELSSTNVAFGGRELGVCFVRDISERKRAEESLRDSEERYRQLFELESDALILAEDDSRNILEVNEAAVSLYGYSRAELLAMKDTDLFAGPDQARRASDNRATDPALHWHRTKDGAVFPVETRGRHFEWKGHPVHVVAIRDVTLRKQAEDALEESKQMLQLVLDTVPLPIFWRDRELRYLGCNLAACHDAGLPNSSAIIGLRDEDLPRSFSVESRLEDDREVVETGEAKLHYEETTVSPSGVNRIMRTSKVPLRDRLGRVFGVLAVYEDVTERTMTMRALRERDEQLRQSQKMEAIGRLAGGIAHDFNNVLTTIIGYADMILSAETCEPESLMQDIAEIRAAAERAGGLTRQILAFSRRQALQPQVLSLNTVISETERLLARTIGADIDLKVDCAPDLGLVEVDEHQFVQVLLNLSVNARDAMPNGGTLTVKTANVELDEEFCQTHPDAHPGSYIMLTVSDTGFGMDAVTAAHIFEPFYTTKAPGKGTGLGLATVYGVVAQSGGCTYVFSEIGLGTTFEIYLPRYDRPRAQMEPSVATPEGIGAKIVLVVDDDVTFRALTTRILEKRGYRVSAVANGEQAVGLLENPDVPVDLLLTEAVLPGSRQGADVAQVAAALRPGLPVLFMSALGHEAMVASGRMEESADYLEKPFTAENLTRLIRESLGSG